MVGGMRSPRRFHALIPGAVNPLRSHASETFPYVRGLRDLADVIVIVFTSQGCVTKYHKLGHLKQ